MTDAQQREAARQFFYRWNGRGKEDEDARSYWIELLSDVYGVETVSFPQNNAVMCQATQLVYNLVKGDLKPRDRSFDTEYTAKLIDSTFKFRGLGDGTAYINSETERLLSSYVSLYLQISFDIREKMAALRTSSPFTADKKAELDSLAASASKYLELGMKQFPREWRNYWAAAFIYEVAGMKKEAVEVIERGLKNVPEFDEGGRARLLMSQQQINALIQALTIANT